MTDPFKPGVWRPPAATGLACLAYTMYDLTSCRVLELTGECDISTFDELERALTSSLSDSPGEVVVDLTHVTFIDAHCVGLLISAGATSMSVVGASGIVSRVLDMLDPSKQKLRRGRPLRT